ncbi:MAG: leucyl/phenylalanyl-tRNA--protein transferase [Desulfovibrio sp.]|nr:MAG: leucyl/phenylalanyl-tRNA--protein transferase [Desulfovibrio sp.]
MPVYWLPDNPRIFPDPELAAPDGLVALGGDLCVDRLLTAYSRGIFPWYGEGLPILWWSLDPRCVLFPENLHVSRSLRKAVDSRRFQVTLDTAFPQVIRECAKAPRPQGDGTWIVEEMVQGYIDLHEAGFAHSVEAWLESGKGPELVGGLYGVSLGKAFFGESMFHTEPDASKVALVHLVEQLTCWGFTLVDCQQTTEHMLRFGAREIPRRAFNRLLAEAIDYPTRKGKWALDGQDPHKEV